MSDFEGINLILIDFEAINFEQLYCAGTIDRLSLEHWSTAGNWMTDVLWQNNGTLFWEAVYL